LKLRFIDKQFERKRRTEERSSSLINSYMKVHEIISERNQQLNEFVPLLAAGLGLGGIITAISVGISAWGAYDIYQFIKKYNEDPQKITDEQWGELWIDAALLFAPGLAKLGRAGLVKILPKSWVIKGGKWFKTKMLKLHARSKVKAAAGAKASRGTVNWRKTSLAVEATLGTLNLVEFYQPWHDFSTYMDYAAEHRKDNSWTEEQYQAELNKQTMVLVVKWAELIAVPGMIKKLLSIVPFAKTLSRLHPPTTNFLSSASDVVIRQWLNDSENAKGIAVAVGMFLGEYVPSLAEVFEKGISLGGWNPVFPKDPNPSKDGTAGSPSGTTDAKGNPAVASTSTPAVGTVPAAGTAGAQYRGKWQIDPKTGKNAIGRQFYDKDPDALRNFDITDWVTGPTSAFIQDPKDKSRILPKPEWWGVAPEFLTPDQQHIKPN
jgi:hypothetical protein